jgi:hypothetical protein
MGWFFIEGMVSLAGSIVDIWRTFREGRQSEIAHRHALRLMEMQHRHDLLLLELRQKQTSYIDVPVMSREFGVVPETRKRLSVRGQTAHVLPPPPETDLRMQRLTIEAEALSDAGYDVVFEAVEDGFGVALPVAGSTLVVWYGPTFPSDPPLILIKTGNAIDRISFADDAWSPDERAVTAVAAIARNM